MLTNKFKCSQKEWNEPHTQATSKVQYVREGTRECVCQRTDQVGPSIIVEHDSCPDFDCESETSRVSSNAD